MELMKHVAAVMLVVLGIAAGAEAQNQPQPISLSFAVGNAVGIGTDASDPQRIYVGSVRVNARRHLALETELTYMGNSADFVSGPGRFTGPAINSVLGQYQQVTTHVADSTWTGALSVLAHSNARLSVFGGGGFGFGVTRHDYVVTYTGCSAPGSPQICSGYSSPRDGSGLTLHLVGGVDARITDRFTAFASTQVQGAYLYGPTALRGLVGLRVRVR